MSVHRPGFCLVALLALPGLAPGAAAAQTIRAIWQMQPYCNRISAALVPSPAGGFAVEGFDDQCGAANPGSVVGQASFNAHGLVTLNATIVTAPDARPVHVSAIVSPATGNGTWTDSVGNAGTFAFFAEVPGMPARPIRASALPPGAIGPTDLATGAVGSAQLAVGAVTGAKVLDGSLTAADLADAPRAAFTDTAVPLVPTTPGVVASITLAAPAAGTVIVNASTWALFFHSASTAGFAQCSLTRATALEAGALSYFGANPAGATNTPIIPVAMTRGFTVAAGSVTVNLVCYRNSTANLQMGTVNMTATYFARP